MLSPLVAALIIVALVVGPLLWRVRQDRRTDQALAVRARVHAALFRAFGGDTFVGVQVAAPSLWGPGRVVLSAPVDWQDLLEPAWRAVASRVPAGYELVVRPASAPRASVPESLPLRRAA